MKCRNTSNEKSGYLWVNVWHFSVSVPQMDCTCSWGANWSNQCRNGLILNYLEYHHFWKPPHITTWNIINQVWDTNLKIRLNWIDCSSTISEVQNHWAILTKLFIWKTHNHSLAWNVLLLCNNYINSNPIIPLTWPREVVNLSRYPLNIHEHRDLPVISWFISPSNYSYKYHKPKLLDL